ncbi:hypothetical protein [Streptomyces hundungensis]|uniref:hypothetical protein n=1 Tax=Streptomyces hundungensis TaxID=1077946 RepID=UPI001DD279FD|nr:hypothetical protein [Streptomyces sp. MAG02]
MSTYTRTPLRAAITVAALAGALLTPAAAFAATSTAASAPAAAQPAADRYDGQKVLVYKDAGHGVIAVLRNGSEGPEAWLRAVGPNWKPGDVWAVRVIATVSRQTPSDTAKEYVPGLKAQLLKADTATPVLRVTAPDGAVKTYALPKGTAAKPTGTPSAKPSGQPGGTTTKGCTVSVTKGIGAGTDTILTMGTKGPSVTFADADGTPAPRLGKLDRQRPKLPESAGIYAEILNPYSAAPKLKYKTQGGWTLPYSYHSFPKLPKGCVLEGASAAKPVNPTAQSAAQTTVVPKGAVAAGAEFKQGGTDKGALIAGGAAVAAAGGLGFVVVRRRSAARI